VTCHRFSSRLEIEAHESGDPDMSGPHSEEISVKTKSADLLIQQGNSGISGLERRPVAAKTPCASVDKAAEHSGQVSWLQERNIVPITVARPRGILTRFPILSVMTEHPNANL